MWYLIKEQINYSQNIVLASIIIAIQLPLFAFWSEIMNAGTVMLVIISVLLLSSIQENIKENRDRINILLPSFTPARWFASAGCGCRPRKPGGDENPHGG